MKPHNLLFLFLFSGLICFIILCGLDPNPFDPRNSNYKKPSLTFDSLKVSDGDTLSINSLLLVARGNTSVNIFRWRTENSNDTDTVWSKWTSSGAGIDTIKLTHLRVGAIVVHIQTAYTPNGDITDTILKFYKVNTPGIVALSDTLVRSAYAQSCTLWVKAAGSMPLSYQWFKDTGGIKGKNIDTLVFAFLQVSDTGHYRCVVSNAWGCDTSKSITVSVIPRFSVRYNKNYADTGAVPVDSNYYKEGAKVTVLSNSGALKRMGYTFSGWNTSANDSGISYSAGATFAVGSDNITLYAAWKINQYDVTFDVRGGSAIAKQTVNYGGFALSPVSPTKADGTFTGWFKDSIGTQVWIFTRDTVFNTLTLYAKWTTKPTFTVTYDANGATTGTAPSNAVNYESGTKVAVLGNLGMLEKNGHTFTGWNTVKDGSGTNYIGGTIVTVDSNNITLYAKWKADQYTVSFDTRGGSAIAKQTVSYGEKALNPALPTKQGLTFTGWFKDSLSTQAWVFTRDTVFSDMTLYANWTTKPTYIVKYDGNGSSGGAVPMEATNYESAAVVTVLGNTGNLAKTGYSFAGWNTAANGSGTDRAPGSTFPMGAENVTLFAQWTINHYTLTYGGNGNTAGAAPPAITKDYNTVITVSANTGSLVKTGYAFTGWNTSAKGSDTDYVAGSTFTIGAADDTLYAKWVINQFTVVFDAQGGSAIVAQKINYGDTATTPTPPAKPGYSFAGWFKESAGINAWIFAKEKITGDVVIFAKWTINQYKMTYDGNGNTGGTAPDATTHDFGTTVTVPANTGNLVKTGYLFGGWNTLPNGTGTNYSPGSTFAMGAANDTLYAKWNNSIYIYTVTFDGQSATTPASPTNKTVASPATTIDALPTPPLKTGYIFGGWFTQPNGAGAAFTASSAVTATITVYAQWNTNAYTVTFDDESATMPASPTSKIVASPATTIDALPTPPLKTGYIFGGWFTQPNGAGVAFTASSTVTATITVYAKWNSYAYTITFDGQSATTSASPASKTVTSPATTIDALPTPPLKTGYIFGGWFTQPNGAGLAFTASSAVSSSITVYAQWNTNAYTVTFDDQGATTPVTPTSKSVTSPAATIDALPTPPLKTGYIFGGWFTQPNGAGAAFTASSAVTATITVYAKWNSYAYIITFDGQSATTPANPTTKAIVSPAVTVGSLPTPPNKTGYTFGGWYTAINGGGTEFTAGSVVTANDTVYAKWNSYSYTITFDDQGATIWIGTTTQTVISPATTVGILLSPPVKTGYAFGGWYTAINGGGTEFTASTIVTVNDTVYAKWNIAYTVTFDDQGATTPASPISKTVALPATTIDALPTPPLKTGYIFAGWFTAVNGGGTEFTVSTVVTASDTIYAKWIIRDADGNVYTTVTIGTQTWMVENLKTTKYNDGTAIPLVTDSAAWIHLNTPGYCWYNNDIANKTTSGALYNWYSVGTGKLAPAGWHVPTDSEWTILTTLLGGESVAGGALKSTNTWQYPNTGATNSSGFSALPDGCRNVNSIFGSIGTNGYWWSSSAFTATYSWYCYMSYFSATMDHVDIVNTYGFSVRCVRDY